MATWDFSYKTRLTNHSFKQSCSLALSIALTICSFLFNLLSLYAQDIGPSVLRSNKAYFPSEFKKLEVSKAGYNFGVAPLANALTGKLSDYYSPGAGLEL